MFAIAQMNANTIVEGRINSIVGSKWISLMIIQAIESMETSFACAVNLSLSLRPMALSPAISPSASSQSSTISISRGLRIPSVANSIAASHKIVLK